MLWEIQIKKLMKLTGDSQINIGKKLNKINWNNQAPMQGGLFANKQFSINNNVSSNNNNLTKINKRGENLIFMNPPFNDHQDNNQDPIYTSHPFGNQQSPQMFSLKNNASSNDNNLKKINNQSKDFKRLGDIFTNSDFSENVQGKLFTNPTFNDCHDNLFNNRLRNNQNSKLMGPPQLFSRNNNEGNFFTNLTFIDRNSLNVLNNDLRDRQQPNNEKDEGNFFYNSDKVINEINDDLKDGQQSNHFFGGIFGNQQPPQIFSMKKNKSEILINPLFSKNNQKNDEINDHQNRKKIVKRERVFNK